MSNLLKFLRLPLKYQLITLETIFSLTWSKLLLLILPFRFLVKILGKKNRESAFEVSSEELSRALVISKAISVLNTRLPWESLCFPQAIASYLMLKSRSIPRTLYLGVKKFQGKLQAHAWVRVGDKIITGHGEIDQYHVVFYVS